MVKDFIQDFENGTSGNNVTVGTSGSPSDAFSQIIFNSGTDVSASGNAFFKYNAASAIRGSMGALWTTSGITNNSYAHWLMPTGHGRRAVIRIPLTIPSNPSVATILTRIDTQNGLFSQIKMNTSGKLVLSGGSPNADIVASTSTYTMPFNTRHWLEHAVTLGTTTSNSVMEYRLITNSNADGSGTDTIVASYTNSAQNLGTDTEFGGTASRFRIQAPFATSGWTTISTDLWRARVTSNLTDWLGPYVTNISTTPDVGAVTVTGVDAPLTGSGAAAVTADIAALTFVGVTPTLSGSGTTTVTADVATLTAAGVDASFSTPTLIDPAVLTYAGVTPTLTATGAASTTVDPGLFSPAGVNLNVTGTSDAAVAADPAVVTTGSPTPVVTGSGDTSTAVDTAVLNQAAVTPTITGSGTGTVNVDPGSLIFNGTQVFLDASVVVAVDPGFFNLTATDADLAGAGSAATSVQPAVLTWQGVETEFRAGRVAIVDPGVFALAGLDSDVNGEGDVELAVDTGFLTLTATETDAQGSGTVTLAAEPATLLWSPQTPGFAILNIKGGVIKVGVVGLRGFERVTGIQNTGLRARTRDNSPTVDTVDQNLRVVAVRSESLTGETDDV